MRKLFALALSTVAVAALATGAQAQMASYSLANPGTAPSVAIVNPFFGLSTDQVGSFNATITGAMGDLGADPFNFKSYCIDLEHAAAVGPQAVTLKNISMVANGNRVAWMYLNSVTASVYDEAALQLAIWDVIYDNGDGVGFGQGSVWLLGAQNPDFTPVAGLDLIAQNYINASVGMSADAWWVSFNNHDNGSNQDIIAPKTSVPEPGSIALLAGGAMGFGVLLRRRNRK